MPTGRSAGRRFAECESKMVRQLKKIAFLVPRVGLSYDQFTRYWRETHGPLVASSPGYGAYRRRYVQNHFVGAGPIGAAFDYAGMAEFWLPDDNEDTFATTPIYRQRIKIDEMNFIDMGATVSLTAVEEIVRPGAGAIKLVVIWRRSALPAAGMIYAGEQVCGAVFNHVIKDSFRLPGARPVQGEIERIDELTFASEVDARRTLPALDGAQGWSAFLAKEYVFFENGRPALSG